MKKALKTFGLWIIFWLWIFFVWWILYLAIKARQTTNPNLGDDWQGLYTSAGGTLSAAKWNLLIQKTTWENVDTSDTANFNTNCERIFLANNYLRTPTSITTTMLYSISANGYTRQISSSNKTKNVNKSDSTQYYPVTKIQKRCR